MAPRQVSFVRVAETGAAATLEVETDTDTSRVDLAREAGAWKVGRQRWQNKR